MSEGEIYIRVDKNNILLEDLNIIDRNEWLNGLDKAGLIRTVNILCKALHENKEKIKTYEDPEDLTLMFMYCDEKAKDKIKGLKKQLEELEEENFNLRENIYIEKMSFSSEGRNFKELIEMPTYEELQKENKKYKEVIDKLKKHCEIEINASSHYLENHSSQQELCHKVAHQRILDILKEVE